MGFELSLLHTEVFICTLSSDYLGEQEKGEIQTVQNKSNLSLDYARDKKNKKKFLNINLISHHSLPTIHSFWVGGFVALGVVLTSFLSVPHAHASDAATNIEMAKKVIKEVAPIVSSAPAPDISHAAAMLETKDYIEKPLVVETKITNVSVQVKGSKTAAASYTGIHYFPYGYCTYYVSQKREITWSGNAGTWLKGAKSAGLKTGEDPQAGAIMVTSEGGGAGHVAYVEKVEDDLVTISEMNFLGFGVVSSRKVSASSKFIKGYVY